MNISKGINTNREFQKRNCLKMFQIRAMQDFSRKMMSSTIGHP